MSRYRKLSTRLHGEDWFRGLSRPQPNAQSLYVYLITGPHTTILPGLFEAGMAGIAERLKWPYPDAEKCFEELFALNKVVFDSDSLVFWVPKQIADNLPPNPNAIKSWRLAWDELPGSLLKYNFLEELESVLNQSDAGVVKPLCEAFPELARFSKQPLSQPLPQPLGQPLAQPLPQRLTERLSQPLANTGTGAGTGLKEKKEKEKKEKRLRLANPQALRKSGSFDEFC